jgi:hypothetical protein
MEKTPEEATEGKRTKCNNNNNKNTEETAWLH